MKKLIHSDIALVWALSALITGVNAIEFEVNGTAETFTKWGFNNQAFNESTQAAPTESFTTLYAQLNLNADLGAGFTFGLGGAIGGLVFDSTRNAATYLSGLTQEDANYGSPVQVSYFGNNLDKGKIQNYMIHNAFLEYRFGEHFYIKAGRYESGEVGEWFDAYTQGAETYVNIGAVKIWGFLSNRRAFSDRQWFWDYWRMNDRYDISGATRNTYAAGLDLTFGGLTLSGFSYYVPTVFTAPGASITFDSNPNFQAQGFRSLTKIRSIFPTAAYGFYGDVSQVSEISFPYIFEQKVEKHTATLYVEQTFEFNRFFFGAGYYQNFGNANAYIGTWGNPLMLDMWTASAWDIGPSLSDMAGRDAITGFGFLGANYGSFDWKFIGRGTNSPRSAEQSVALYLNWQFKKHMSVGGKLEWFSDTTKAGYSPLVGYYGGGGSDGSEVLAENRTDDRSHLFFYIQHSF